MEKLTPQDPIQVCQIEELTEDEQNLIELAIEATTRSYSPYSHFSVGAAVLLENGVTMIGCNQENAAFPVSICAERVALFAAGAQYPSVSVAMLAIAARDGNGILQNEPVSPCGSCRQAILETETRFNHPVKILLYGQKKVYVVESIKALMPLAFTEF